MAPPATDDSKGLFDKARDYVHEKVATDEQLQKEKPMDERIQDAMPKSTDDAANKVGEAFNKAKEDFKERFDERLNEGKEQSSKENNQDSPGILNDAKDKIYDATKSPDVKDREKFRQADIGEKINIVKNDMKEQQDKKPEDTIPLDSLLS